MAAARQILRAMILRRDGTIDVRVLMVRVAQYGSVVLIAAALGALIALAGP